MSNRKREKKRKRNIMSLEKFINSTILGFVAVNVKRTGDSYKKNTHNVIVANKPIKKDWRK